MSSNNHKSPFEREINRADRRYRKMRETLDEMRQRLGEGDVDGAYQEALNFADASEKLTLCARQLPAYTGHPQAPKMIEQVISENVPVNMGFTPEGWFGVVIPALLPKKVKSGSADYIRDILYPALGKFFRGKDPVRYTDCVIIYRHVYQRDRPEREYRDHDNIEVNMVTDIIAMYVLFDDSPLRCSHYYCSARGDENRTEIFVVPQRDFSRWLLAVRTGQSKELMLFETRQ